jgi:hypothetical protein
MTPPALVTPLGLLFARLACWNSISDFEQAMQDYFSGKRSQSEIADFRAKRGALKALRDEVTPVLHHLKFVKAKGEVKFALNNTVPDCWLRDSPEIKPQGLEVTVAQSREQHHLGRELNEKRMGRGFLGLPDNASSKAFSDRLARPRVMYSTESALEVIGNGIKSCLKKKADPRYTGFDLLVEAPLRSLPDERWSQIEDDLRLSASKMPFREIHVIGNQDTEPFGFRIK